MSASPIVATEPTGVHHPRWSVEQSLPECFARQARGHADRIAISEAERKRSYAELEGEAAAVAARIVASGGGHGDRVAIAMRHGGALLAAVLGALAAGRVVVVLDPDDPATRLAATLEDAEVGMILADRTHAETARQLAGEQRRVVLLSDADLHGAGALPPAPSGPDDAAFLVYTSGSTGRPKGVVQTHRMVLHNALRHTAGMALEAEDRIALLASLAGGQGVATAWCTLLNGATACPFTLRDHGGVELPRWLQEQAISVLVASASLFRHLLRTFAADERFPSVRLVRLASEPATGEDVAAWRRHFGENCVLLNTLSSSETGNLTQLRLRYDEPVPEGRLSVGWPAPGVEVLLRDEQGREDDRVESGEIVVRSRYLSPGYWRNDALTAERFAPADADGLRTFRSGDLARRRPNGSLLFLGRKDARVKVRGHGVEPSEVEDLLRRHQAVEHAAVLARSDEDGEVYLAAYVTLRQGRASSDEALRRSLRAALPGAMAPATWAFLDAMPLTAGGKIDREGLRRIEPPARKTTASDGPRTTAEAVLADLWRRVLRGVSVGRNDDFFDLGGDSLGALVVAAQVHAAFGVELELRGFADAPTLAQQAAWIERLRNANAPAGLPPLVRVPRGDPLPVSFGQERIWRYSQTSEGSAGYTIAVLHRLRGPLDFDALRSGVRHLVARHESLRTTFLEVDGAPMQVVRSTAPLDLSVIDLSEASDREAEVSRIVEREIRNPFDLARLPLIRFRLVRMSADDHLLLRINHHVISDGWSWHVWFRELAMLYESHQRGEPPPLPDSMPWGPADHAAWQRRVLQPEGSLHRAQVAWWSKQLHGAPQPLEVPCRRPRPDPEARAEDGFVPCRLEPEVECRIDRVGRDAGATRFGVRLAAFSALAAFETRNLDAALGIYLTNRDRVELQEMFGFFSNLATLRLRFEPSCTFREWVFRVQQAVREVQEHGEIPYEQLCQRLRSEGLAPPDLRTIFGTPDRGRTVQFGGLEIYHVERRIAGMPWGFALGFEWHREGNRAYARFDARIYDPQAVRTFLGRLRGFLRAAADRPDEPCARLLSLPAVTAAPGRG